MAIWQFPYNHLDRKLIYPREEQDKRTKKFNL